jgi:hypothetical protein
MRVSSLSGLRSAPDVRRAPRRIPDALEAEIVQVRQTLSSGGLGPVSADGIRKPLRQHGGDSIPSRRTISRILKRQAKEVTAYDFPS